MPLINGKIEPLELPQKHARVLLTQGRRYRALWGGRNGAKDWSMTAVAIERGVRVPTRFLFTREIQKTIRDSAHRLISDTIQRLGYGDYYTITDTKIKANNIDSSFIFTGLRDLNAENIKSMEGIDIAVVGEAQTLTKNSFTILDPTIRKPGSEIWFQFNPKFDDDFVYEFCVTNPPHNLIGEEVNYLDNPWTSQEIIDQAERMKREDEALYRHVWLGETIGQGGRVYPQYDPLVHEVEFDMSYLPQCNLYMAIDPHRKYYPAIKWYAVTPSNMVVVYNEWPKYEDFGMYYDEVRETKTFDLTLKELASRILANDYTFQYGAGPVTRVGDPRFLNENPDFVRELHEHGVHGWTDAPFERIETQRENLKNLLYYNITIPRAGTNVPDWYVDKKCRNSRRCYIRHSFDQKEGKDKESEEYKDFVDTDRYFLSIVDGKPRYQEPKSSIPIAKPISLAQHQLAGMPAHGYRLSPVGGKV